MIFSVNIINHTNPQTSVITADASSGIVTAVKYNQIKQSFGQYVYNTDAIYIYSDNLNQLSSVVNFSRFDATGNQNITNIPLVVDPYQFFSSLNVDLNNNDTSFILNGNSSFSFDILPFAKIVLQIKTRRITNSFGNNLNNFKSIENIFRDKNFFKYGDISQIQETSREVKEEITKKSFDGGGVVSEYNPIEESDVLLYIFLVSLGAIYFYKKYKK
jgi:hypothetical protein